MSLVDAKPPSGTRLTRFLTRWRVPLFAAGIAVVLLLSPLWAPLLLRQTAFFRVRRVEIVGARYLPASDIIARLRVDTLASIWDPTGPLESRVATHPLVREVMVDRRLPGTLVVRVVEHSPVALVATGSGLRAYDERGVPLPIDPVAADVDVPVVTTPDSALLRLLGAARVGLPELYDRLSEARRVGGGEGPSNEGDEVVLVLDSLSVRAMADVTLERLADMALVERDVARRRLRATELDFRYKDQVIVRLQ